MFKEFFAHMNVTKKIFKWVNTLQYTCIYTSMVNSLNNIKNILYTIYQYIWSLCHFYIWLNFLIYILYLYLYFVLLYYKCPFNRLSVRVPDDFLPFCYIISHLTANEENDACFLRLQFLSFDFWGGLKSKCLWSKC